MFFFVIPREDSVISLNDNYLELDFIVTQKAGGHARYSDDDHIRLVNFAVFSKYKLTSCSGKKI